MRLKCVFKPSTNYMFPSNLSSVKGYTAMDRKDHLLQRCYTFSGLLLAGVLAGTGIVPHASAESTLHLKDVPQSNILFLIDDALNLDFEKLMDREEEERLRIDDYKFYFLYDKVEAKTRIRPHCTKYNQLAYDPSKTYRPWWGKDSEGNTFQDQTDITSVPFDPYLPKSVGIDDADEIARNQNNEVDLSRAFYLVWNDDNGNGEYDDGECPAFDRIDSRPYISYDCVDHRSGDAYPSNECVKVSDMSSDEKINFANWYAYHRKREYVLKYSLAEVINKSQARIGLAFGSAPKFHNTVSRGVEVKDVDDISLPIDTQARANKEELLARVFGFDTKGVGKDTSQVRRMYEAAGNYFERGETYDNNDSSGVRELFGYDEDEAEPESPIIIKDARGVCQSNASIVITGRTENGSDSSRYSRRIFRDNVDGDNSSDYDGTWNGSSTSDSYADEWTDTLADVAMFFYERDLYPDVDDAETDIIQRMSSHMVALGIEGTLKTGPESANKAFNWPQRKNNKPETIDDMRHAAWNGRGRFHNPMNGDELEAALKDILFNIELAAENDANAVGSNMLSVTSLRASSPTYAYVTRFEPSAWTGQLLAYPINQTTLALEDLAWNAADLIPAHAKRNIFSHNGDNSFEFTTSALSGSNGFSDSQKASLNALDGATDDLAEKRVAYLRGDQTNEGSTFRSRTSLLGDIVNSDAFYTYDENHGYYGLEEAGSDNAGDYYSYLKNQKRTRRSMIYVGANDGMLHGFYASADANLSDTVDAATCKDTTANCAGEEAFAYIPKSVYGNLSNLTDPDYSHNYFVDGPAIVSDAFINFKDGTSSNERWGSVLLGSLGIGGAGVFALDVSEPDSFSSNDVLWDLDATDLPELGSLSGRMALVKLQDDSWAAVFGNGYDSANHKAGLYIVPLEKPEDAVFIDTKATGTADSPNGLSAPLVTDGNGDNKADRIYAGDLQGNMWVFDLSSTNSADWKVAFGNSASPDPLFRACTSDDCSSPQPITMRPEVVKYTGAGGGKVVLFGTGSYRSADDVGSTQVQTFYGVHDDGTNTIANRSRLQPQIIEKEYSVATTGEHRITSKNKVDYSSKDGWYIDFDSSRYVGERMITDPVVRRDTVRFFTFTVEGGVCSRNGGESWFMELDYLSGARADSSTFDVNGDNRVDADDLGTLTTGTGAEEKAAASGFKADGLVKTPDFASNGENNRLRGDSSGGALVERAMLDGPPTGRQSWSQLR